MTLKASDIVPIGEAWVRLSELAEDLAGNSSESHLALVAARRLNHYQAPESEHARRVLADDAITGLRQALAGHFSSDEELDKALGVAFAP
ncbi:type II toxin-antitoxin system Phd/YefM family antitoxin [Variovorax rhizosphaerae]|uniref:Type II toxin-antitoxin system Phd/YefM family antitoxin n=1 Tax=Variovorax rhizosphaerae TaxID=1836200 RepID=A0ABU8WTX5_9BURK